MLVAKETRNEDGDCYNDSNNDAICDEDSLLCGDLDQSGKHDVSDIVLLVNYILEIGDGECSSLADISGDGSITVSDIVDLVNYILKTSTAESNCSCSG